MIDHTSLILFISAALVLVVTPGPAVLYIVARSLEQGRLAGLTSTLGIALAAIVHVVVAALGLSALLMQSAVLFSLVKYLGAAYLIYLGLRTWLAKSEAVSIERLQRKTLTRIFWQGFMVNLLNPKTALFFLAFLPQFVNPHGGPVTGQIMILGAIFVGIAVVSDGLYAGVAGTVRQLLAGSRRVARLQKAFAGTVYIGLGITTALSGSGTGPAK